MEKNFITEEETMNKAKELGLSPEAAECIQQTPSGKFTSYMKGKFVKPPEFKHPDVHSLVQIAATENGKSEVSCVIDQDGQGHLKANNAL